jgi:insertion element IS1 protein InsB
MWILSAKEHQRWLINMRLTMPPEKSLPMCSATAKRCGILALKELLEPFGITRFYTDDWGAYERHLPTEQQVVGKRNTQKIERKHLTLRTRIKRLARKTICFSKLEKMHDIVIGIFINRYEFGVLI